MKLIIAGSRHILEGKAIEVITQVIPTIVVKEIVSGGARGVDRAGEKYAVANNISLRVFPANWDKYGKSAGYRRNEEMAKYGTALLLIWDGQSKGSSHMKALAEKYKLTIFERII